MKYEINAQGKKIGRVASEAASVLMGKNLTSFAKNKIAETKVHILHANSLEISAKKKSDDVYVTFTGWRGGLKEEKLGELIARRGMAEVLKRAVYRMLPDNKLRKGRMKNLTVSE